MRCPIRVPSTVADGNPSCCCAKPPKLLPNPVSPSTGGCVINENPGASHRDHGERGSTAIFNWNKVPNTKSDGRLGQWGRYCCPQHQALRLVLTTAGTMLFAQHSGARCRAVTSSRTSSNTINKYICLHNKTNRPTEWTSKSRKILASARPAHT
jgi:hypothetical protein